MNAPTDFSSPSPAADEQASLWAVRLEGAPLSSADHAALQTWLAASPAHAQRLSEYRQLSFDLDQQLPALAKAGGMAFPSAPAPAFARSSRKWSWVLGLAGAGAAAVFAIAVWKNHAANMPDLVLTAKGSRRSFTMADGTQVELNAATRLRIEKSTAERLVSLEDGEAYFHVAQDRVHPFIVETPGGSVQVTGTMFDVRSESPSQLEVTVTEGSVKVFPKVSAGSPLQGQTLGAGDHLSATTQGVTLSQLSSDDLQTVLAWRQGRAVFVESSVSEAIAAFSRYHEQRLSVTPAAGREKVTGVYKLNDLDEFLAGVERLGLIVKRAPDGSSITVSLSSEP